METRNRIIAVGNLKGGVGKSTLAVNLACSLATRHQRTLLIDADGNQTARSWANHRPLPCAIAGVPVEELSTSGAWHDLLGEAASQYERIVVDLPAVLPSPSIAAFEVAHAILVPSSPSPLDLDATARTIGLAVAATSCRPSRAAIFVAPMQVRWDWLGRMQDLEPMRRIGASMAPAIAYDPAFGRAFMQHDCIGGLAPRSRGAMDIEAMADVLEATLSAVDDEPASARAAVAKPVGRPGEGRQHPHRYSPGA